MKEISLQRVRNPISAAVQIALLATAPASITFAQNSEAGDLTIDEIIVTSRKREESLVEVPMNIATVNEQEILARNLFKKEDIYRTVAGAASPRGQLILRGLSGGNDSTPDTTSAWTDDIPYDSSDLFDVQRVEVLRGPQGTLFGSNAIGGTVRIITNKPDFEKFEVFGATVIGDEVNRSGTATRVYAGVNFPISDTVAARVIGSYGQKDGKIRNTYTNSDGRNEDHFLRAQLMFQPSDDWNINLTFINDREQTSGYEYADRSTPGYYYEAELTENPAATYGYDVTLSFPDCPNATDERPACRTGGPVDNAKFSVWETLDPWTDDEKNVFSVRVAKDNIFNGADLVYAAAYQKYEHDSLDNWSRNDANDMFRTWIINDDGYDRYSHELRLMSNGDGPFEWTVGAFFDETDWKSTPNGQWQYHASDNRSRAIAEYLWGYYWGLGDPTQIGLDLYDDPTKNYNYNQIKYNNKETAFFGEVGYTFEFNNGHSLELTAGIRNYDLKDDIHTEVSGIWIGPDAQETITNDGEDGNRYKFAASWMPNDSMSIFALYSEGYRPGGNNGPNAPNDCLGDTNIGGYVDRYQSDQIENMEIGFKGLAFERRFQFSAAVYRIDWTGVQASVYMPSCGFSYTANAASAVSEGVEFESTTLLTDSLQLQVNAAYTDSRMTSDVPTLGAEDGDSMTMVPEYNFYIALDQTVNVWNRDGSVRLDYAGYGEYKSHFNTKDEDISPAYEVLNLSTSLNVNDNVRLGFYVNNVLNDEIITYKRSRVRSDWSLGDIYYYYGDERAYSLRLDFTF
ncbi:TonB-dependent receptor [Woeseia oceani]|uniref:TonB-dependent receptor n=1 Tax=Woeseia oceani TaxID=1548547 RepID=UPI0009F250EE|nr:TonB-dependent receptor [Woeseia oceani]